MGIFKFNRKLRPDPPMGLGSFVYSLDSSLGFELPVRLEDFNSMQPPYFQIDDFPFFRIRIVGYGNGRNNFFAELDANGYQLTPPYYCKIFNGTNKVLGFMPDGSILNNEYTSDEIEEGLMIIGVASTSTHFMDYVTFIATSWDPSTGMESEWSVVTGRIYINNTINTNSPPTRTGTKILEAAVGQPTTIPLSYFRSTNPSYLDPEGDDILKIKVQTLPNNVTLLFNNIPVVVGQEIMASDINQGALKYIIQPNGTLTDFKWDVADVGSGQFSGL